MITPLEVFPQFSPLQKRDGCFLKTTYFYEFPFFWGGVSVYKFSGGGSLLVETSQALELLRVARKPKVFFFSTPQKNP